MSMTVTASPLNVLLVEDDENLGYLLEENLRMKGYDPVLCKNGEEAWQTFNKGRFDLCIIDVMLPKKDGFTLTQQIRTRNKEVPLIFLTAKSSESDVVKGFELGCDDYVCKPFSSRELFHRINALMKRSGKLAETEKSAEGKFLIGSFEFDSNTRVLKDATGSRKLSTKESELLKVLASNANKLVSRSTLLSIVWGNDDYFASKSMDVYLSRLRKLLAPYPFLEIQNVHGTGFKLIVKEEHLV